MTSMLSKSLLAAPATGDHHITPELRQYLFKLTEGFSGIETFGMKILSNLNVKEMGLQSKEEEPDKLEARMVFETTVEEHMLNDSESMHGGCAAFLIDFCSSIALSLLLAYHQRSPFHVSQTLTIVYHAPAKRGAKLRIVNKTVSLGKRIMSARTEIYDADNSRLVASGIHTKMAPSSNAKDAPTRIKANL